MQVKIYLSNRKYKYFHIFPETIKFSKTAKCCGPSE